MAASELSSLMGPPTRSISPSHWGRGELHALSLIADDNVDITSDPITSNEEDALLLNRGTDSNSNSMDNEKQARLLDAVSAKRAALQDLQDEIHQLQHQLDTV
jgi:hypothetical protein